MVTDDNVLTNLCHSEYSKCIILARMQQARIRLRHWSCNGIVNNAFPLQPTHQSDAVSNHSHAALLSRRLVAELRTGLTAWLFGDHKSSMINAWRFSAFSFCVWYLITHFRPKSRRMITDNHYRGMGETVSLDIWCVAGLLG